MAARVEAATRKAGDVVLVAENVKRLLRDGAVQLEERPGVQLKGKGEAATLYAPSPTESGGDSGRFGWVREPHDAARPVG